MCTFGGADLEDRGQLAKDVTVALLASTMGDRINSTKSLTSTRLEQTVSM